MQALSLTETVRSILSEEAAAYLVAALNTLLDRPGFTTMTEWHLDGARERVCAVQLLDPATKLPGEFPGPLCVSIAVDLPAGAITGIVPEEHTLLIIQDGRVWTFGDLAFTNVNRYFYGIDFKLGPHARDRMVEKLRSIDPTALHNVPVWPRE